MKLNDEQVMLMVDGLVWGRKGYKNISDEYSYDATKAALIGNADHAMHLSQAADKANSIADKMDGLMEECVAWLEASEKDELPTSDESERLVPRRG